MRDARLILAAKTVRTFGYGLLVVLLGVYLDKAGYEPSQVGLILSTALLGSALLTSFFAARADRIGRRRTLIASTLLMVAGGLAFAAAQNVWLLILAALSGTISVTAGEVGPFETIEQSMLPQTVAPERRTYIFGWYSTLSALAVSGGSLASGLTEPLGTALGLDVLGSYRLMFVLYAALGLATVAMFASLSERVEVAPLSRDDPRRAPLHRSRAVVAKLAALFALDAFGGGFILQSILAYWFARQFNAGPEVVGPVFFGANIMKALSYQAAVRLAGRYGLINTMVFSHLPSNVMLMLLPFSPSLGAAVVIFLARHLLSQMDVPTRASYVAAIVDPDERTVANGVINLTRTITQAVSPSLAGFSIGLANLAAPFLLGGAIKIVYDLLLYFNFREVWTPEEVAQGSRDREQGTKVAL